MSKLRNKHFLILVVLLAALLAAAGCRPTEQLRSGQEIPEGDPRRGQQLVVDYGCTSCHIVPGVRVSPSLVGPPLDYWADRGYIAGRLPNTTQNLISWIMAPQTIDPGNAMPDMDVTYGDAVDIAAYLYTLRYGR
jgi:cytochrome c